MRNICWQEAMSSKSLVLTLVSGLVADKPPKPSLSAWPSTVFKLGKAITLQCRVPHPVLEFCLEWEERATSQKFSVDGDFIISNVEGKGTGTYSCSYRIEAHPNIWSHRSEPLKLMGPAGERKTLHRGAPTMPLAMIPLGSQSNAQQDMERVVGGWFGHLSPGVVSRSLKGSEQDTFKGPSLYVKEGHFCFNFPLPAVTRFPSPPWMCSSVPVPIKVPVSGLLWSQAFSPGVTFWMKLSGCF